MNTFILHGSTSSKSINKKVLEYIKLNFEGIEELVLNQSAPIYSIDEEEKGFPESISSLAKILDGPEKLIILTPEHNGLPTAHLKNQLDWLSRVNKSFLQDKNILVVSTSPGKLGGQGSNNAIAGSVKFYGAKNVEQITLGSYYDLFTEDNGKIEFKVEAEKNEFIEKVNNFLK